jgi:hypothetical protein
MVCSAAVRAARARPRGDRPGQTVRSREAMRITCWIRAWAAAGSSPPVLARCSHTRVVTTGEVAQVKKLSRGRVGSLSRRCSRSKWASISTSTA